MGVVVLSNPKSGAGKARRLAEQAVAVLEQAGHGVKHLQVGGSEKLDPLRLGKARALVVVGGDGTVLRSAEAAATANCPLYHLPTGNENLFSRMFGMSRDMDVLVRAMGEGSVHHVDLGDVRIGEAHEPFLLMCSVGPDAGVIRRLAASRRRALGHAAYTLPVLAEGLRPLLPRISLEVDGRAVVDGAQGWVIVANCSEYALRMNPVRDAAMDDGLLDAVFLPARSAVGAVGWLWRCARKGDLAAAGAVVVRGELVRVAAEPVDAPVCYQVDGETAGCLPEQGDRLELGMSVRAGYVPVLTAT